MPQWSDEGEDDGSDIPPWLLTLVGLSLVISVAVALWLWLLKGGTLTLEATSRESSGGP